MPRGPDRAERAVPPGPAARRRRRRLHRPQARPRRDQVRPAADGAACSRRPTASSPTRNRSCGWRASWPASRSARPTSCAARWARRTPRRCRRSATRFIERLHARAASPEKKADEDLRVHRVLRRLRLQQVALDDLRAARVSDRVSQGELPAPLHGGAADDRVAELRQGRAVPGRVPRAGRAGAAAGHQRQPAGSSSSQPDGVRFGLGAVKGAGEGAIRSMLEARAGARRPDHVAVRAGRAHRSAAGEQEGAREPDQGRRVRLARARRARDAIWRGGRGCWPGSTASSTTAAGTSAIATRASRSCSAATTSAGEPLDDDVGAAGRARPWTETEALAFEKEALGLYMSGHPLQRYAEALAAVGARRLQRADAVGGRLRRSAGIVTGLRPAQDQARRSHGGVHARGRSRPRSRPSCFPEAFGKFGGLVVDDAMLLVRGKYERDEEIEPAGRVARSRRSTSCARTRRAGGRDPAGRQGARPRRACASWPTCSIGIPATAGCRSSSK